MSVNSIIPKNSKLAVIGGIFKAVLSNPLIDGYDFTNYSNKVNASIDLGLAMNANYLYFFHQLNFSMSIDPSVFLQSISPDTVPIVTIRETGTGKNIFLSQFRLFRFFENMPIDSFLFNANANARINGDFQCQLVKTSDLVGTAEIFAQISLSVYEIQDINFIEEYKRNKK